MTDIDARSQYLDILKCVKEEFPKIKSNFTFHEEISILKSIEAGINGYILKSEPFEMISPLLKLRHGGRIQSFSKNVQNTWFIPRNHVGIRLINPREKEVLDFIAKGFSNIEIAEKFNLSVRNH